jgi:hypothetical protein
MLPFKYSDGKPMLAVNILYFHPEGICSDNKPGEMHKGHNIRITNQEKTFDLLSLLAVIFKM